MVSTTALRLSLKAADPPSGSDVPESGMIAWKVAASLWKVSAADCRSDMTTWKLPSLNSASFAPVAVAGGRAP